jgi:uncharacterized protein (TIGR03067 family)
MKTLLSLAMLLGLFGLTRAADDKDPTAGKWITESVTRDGAPVAALKGATREHADGKYTFTPTKDSTAQPATGTYKLDTTKTPITVDLTAKGGTYDGKTLQGIVKVDGDTMTIAFAEPGKERPTKFESTKGSGVVVAVFKKAK